MQECRWDTKFLGHAVRSETALLQATGHGFADAVERVLDLSLPLELVLAERKISLSSCGSARGVGSASVAAERVMLFAGWSNAIRGPNLRSYSARSDGARCIRPTATGRQLSPALALICETNLVTTKSLSWAVFAGRPSRTTRYVLPR
jgi:hypothetical protein